MDCRQLTIFGFQIDGFGKQFVFFSLHTFRILFVAISHTNNQYRLNIFLSNGTENDGTKK